MENGIYGIRVEVNSEKKAFDFEIGTVEGRDAATRKAKQIAAVIKAIVVEGTDTLSGALDVQKVYCVEGPENKTYFDIVLNGAWTARELDPETGKTEADIDADIKSGKSETHRLKRIRDAARAIAHRATQGAQDAKEKTNKYETIQALINLNEMTLALLEDIVGV